ncbi:MAG: YihA family ribosome biogenesis GTP-binding protein [Clostridia bacterium]|nr:YihA family ribosome biogenesis GTP-binding protein [Clostridia bacterium]
MEITKAEFSTSMSSYRTPPKEFSQIAMAGRSNVGKSSLINCVCRRSKLARVGEAPGKTRLINFFEINESFYLVDLPGYGYAKASKAEIERWGEMMERYFADSEHLCGVIHIVDIRHEPTKDDLQMNAFLRARGIPFVVVLSKADKISRGARMKYMAPILRALQVQPWQAVVFSAENGDGRENVLSAMEGLLQGQPFAKTSLK